MIVDEMFIDPRRIKVCNQKQIDYYVELFNGVKHLYKTVYHFEDRCTHDRVYIDKIYLDFDAQDDGFFDDVKTVATYLYEKNIKFYIRFSGRGFHIFIMLAKEWLQDPRKCIKSYVKKLHKITNTQSDSSVVGDIRRVVRMPNTINIKSNKYCIPITYKTLMNSSYDDICKLADYPTINGDYINGDHLLDISEFDGEITFHNSTSYIHTDVKINNDLPPCVKKMMEDPTLGHEGRVYVIVCLRELGYTKDEIYNILGSFLSDEKFDHSIHSEKQLENLVDNETLLFASCKTLYENGWCTDTECDGQKIYY